MRKQFRVSVDPALWEASEAAAKAIGMTHSNYVERALKMMIDPVSYLENADRIASETLMALTETQDQIRFLARYVADTMRDPNGV